jgi:hypothetical protein
MPKTVRKSKIICWLEGFTVGMIILKAWVMRSVYLEVEESWWPKYAMVWIRLGMYFSSYSSFFRLKHILQNFRHKSLE